MQKYLCEIKQNLIAKIVCIYIGCESDVLQMHMVTQNYNTKVLSVTSQVVIVITIDTFNN